MANLATLLDRVTREGELFEALPLRQVRCIACGHRCLIPPGQRGICKVRFNAEGVLRVPFGYVAGLNVDPIEKKPFFHVMPGARALSFGMLGCNLHCPFCQNWTSSQAIRDPAAGAPIDEVTPSDLIRVGRRHGAPIVTSTYNEPTITSEWAKAVFREARSAGMLCGFVSNGYASSEAVEYLSPELSLCNVDLKSFRDEGYRQLGGTLAPVLNTIRDLHARGVWVEVITLVVPGFNDSDDELESIAAFLVSVSPDIPWHVTAFHPDYRQLGGSSTDAVTLLRAVEIGGAAGLHYVYVGNLPGIAEGENTRCPGCRTILVERQGYRIRQNRVANGRCPECQREIAGFWQLPDTSEGPKESGT
ncbi:MAG: AmmeMemoRadiSam system radical SAM enzyme [Vicinamibacteria bacterium]|nr:AmmeMemoRadiSam system radical SAM enzyme [Vicinamibacteria bacterium]